MNRYDSEIFHKFDIKLLKSCFIISIFMSLIYNVSIIALYEIDRNFIDWWLGINYIVQYKLSLFIPAFSRVADEMNSHGYGEKILLFNNIMAFNFLILISFFFIELVISLIISSKNDKYLYKSIISNLSDIRRKRTGKSFSILKSRFLVFFGFISANAAIYTGVSFLFPFPLYSDQYKILIVSLVYSGDFGVNLGFLIYFIIMPFWVRPPMGV